MFFPINDVSKSVDNDVFPFKIERQSFKYLSEQVTSSFKSLKKANFDNLLEQTRKDLERWTHLPVSLAGRINALKMTILLRFLYISQQFLSGFRNIFLLNWISMSHLLYGIMPRLA